MESNKDELGARYQQMSDTELLKIAEDAEELTDTALQALQGEIEKRRLTMPGPRPAQGYWESQRPVVVERFLNLHEALLAKGQLESAGIRCSLVDDNMVRIDWFISNLLGGVKLAVAPEHESEARELLAQPIPDNFEVDGLDYEQPRCPKCQSLDISFEALNKPYAYGSAWLGVPIPFGANRWRCHQCGSVWEGMQDEAPHP